LLKKRSEAEYDKSNGKFGFNSDTKFLDGTRNGGLGNEEKSKWETSDDRCKER
jgi:hypothetical protein